MTPPLGAYQYYANQTVSVNAETFLNCPNIYRFDHWEGEVTDANASSTTVGMDDDKTDELEPLARLDAEFVLITGTLRALVADLRKLLQ